MSESDKSGLKLYDENKVKLETYDIKIVTDGKIFNTRELSKAVCAKAVSAYIKSNNREFIVSTSKLNCCDKLK